jgi:hypothetical protein
VRRGGCVGGAVRSDEAKLGGLLGIKGHPTTMKKAV